MKKYEKGDFGADGTFESSINKPLPRIWTGEEDRIMVETITEYPDNWGLVVEKLKFSGYREKTVKQCRERWNNHLNPELSKEQFTPEEEEVLFRAHKQYGNKWVEIAKLIKGRSDNQIKNYFYCKLRRCIRKLNARFKAEAAYKRLHINESLLLKALNTMNITLLEFNSLTLSETGDHLLQTRRKKRKSLKKSSTSTPTKLLVVEDVNNM